MPAKTYDMVALSVRVPVATAEEINRVADGLGVRRSHFYAVILAAGFRDWSSKRSEGSDPTSLEHAPESIAI